MVHRLEVFITVLDENCSKEESRPSATSTNLFHVRTSPVVYPTISGHHRHDNDDPVVVDVLDQCPWPKQGPVSAVDTNFSPPANGDPACSKRFLVQHTSAQQFPTSALTQPVLSLTVAQDKRTTTFVAPCNSSTTFMENNCCYAKWSTLANVPNLPQQKPRPSIVINDPVIDPPPTFQDDVPAAREDKCQQLFFRDLRQRQSSTFTESHYFCDPPPLFSLTSSLSARPRSTDAAGTKRHSCTRHT